MIYVMCMLERMFPKSRVNAMYGKSGVLQLLLGLLPYDKLFGHSPCYTHLRTFGCLAYATNLHPQHKFDVWEKNMFS